MNSEGYHSIPQTTATENARRSSFLKLYSWCAVEQSDIKRRRRFGFPLVHGKLLTLLAVTAALAAVLFVADKSNLWLPRLNYDQFHFIPRTSGSRYSRPFHYGSRHIQYYLQQKYSGLMAQASPPSLNSVIHSDECPGDSITQKAVPTKDCSRGLACRARVVVTIAGTGITIQAGYYIYGIGNRVRNITRRTKQRVKAVTPAEATKWAKRLLAELGTKLEEVDCTVTVPMIAHAIMETKDDAASCQNTNDSRCSELITLRGCTCETEPVIENECYNFLASDPGVASFEDLQKGCTDADFYYNRVWTSLPFCTYTCPSEPSLLRTFDADFHVQGGNSGGNELDLKNGLAVAIPPAYENLALPLPSCDDMPSFEEGDEVYSLSVYNAHETSEPEFLTYLSEERGVTYMYAYFAFNVASSQEYISSACES